MGGIFTALIRMEDEWYSSFPDRFFKHLKDETGGVMEAQLPREKFTSVPINHGGQIQLAALPIEFGEVTVPDHRGSNW